MGSAYDVIVIGSGMGALAFASLAAQLEKKRVLILERHFKLGGFTHTFRRQDFSWDVGVHYIGGMMPGATTRHVFDLITDRGVNWQKMPEHFDVFEYPDFSFALHEDKKQFQSDLIEKFPAEESAIHQYFKDVEATVGWFQKQTVAPMLPAAATWLMNGVSGDAKTLALQSTKSYLDKHFKDSKLKALLASQWGDYGLPPSLSPFALHAMIVKHYFGGGFYPIGGAGRIAESIVPIVKASGGDCLVNHRVVEVVVENGVAKGVKAIASHGANEEEVIFLADVVVSDAGQEITLSELVPEKYKLSVAPNLQRQCATNVTLYLGLNASVEKLGLQGENRWIYGSYDHEQNYSNRKDLVGGEISSCYLSFPSLKDPTATSHTAEIIAFTDYDSFEPWRHGKWKQRGDEYENVKNSISEKLIELVEKHHPGFRDMIVYKELSTPLTVETFTGNKTGAIYGHPGTVDEFRKKTFDPRTKIKNLYLTGSDVVVLGVMGALMGGVVTASHLYGGMPFFLKVMGSKSSKIGAAAGG